MVSRGLLKAIRPGRLGVVQQVMLAFGLRARIVFVKVGRREAGTVAVFGLATVGGDGRLHVQRGEGPGVGIAGAGTVLLFSRAQASRVVRLRKGQGFQKSRIIDGGIRAAAVL